MVTPAPADARGRRQLLLALGSSALMAGCASPVASPDQIETAPEIIKSSLRFQKEYLLAPGDQIEVVVWRVPEASRVVVVRPDGMISLPLLQDVQAAGLSPRELADNLGQRLSSRLVSPQVNVLPQVVRQASVYVFGDVNSPAAVPLRNANNALQALAAAGGPRRSGNESQASLIRLGSDGYLRAMPLQNSPSGQPGGLMALAAVPLMADDIIFVPESRRSEVMRFLDDFVLKPLQTVLSYKLISSL